MSGWTPEPEGTPLAGPEVLARAVIASRWVNKATNAVKPEAFEPPPSGALSVTRHAAGDEAVLWSRCRAVAVGRQRALHGRADLTAEVVAASEPGMNAVAAAREHDPGHAHILGWPPDESLRISVQQTMAAAAKFVPAPPPTAV